MLRDVLPLAPLLVCAAASMLVLLLGPWLPPRRRVSLAYLSVLALIAAGALLVPLWGPAQPLFGGTFLVDRFFVFFGLIACGVTALGALLASDYHGAEGPNAGEFYALLLLAASGMLLMIGAADLIVVFLGLEMLSLSLYVLAGSARQQLPSLEAALKYFLLGAFASSFFVYGAALVYGATGSTSFSAIAQAARAGAAADPLLLAGLGLLLVGFAFKLAFVPFHMWTPDVYEGAPTPVTAFMSVGTKAAAFAALLRLLTTALPDLRPDWTAVLWVLAVLTMVVGNVAALTQRNVKRMLAYSSIAQAGYALIGLVAANQAGLSGVAFYVLAYAAMNLGAFTVVTALAQRGEEHTQLRDYAGLAARQPWLAALMALFMLSLAGIPPTAGFWAKLTVFGAAVQAGFVELAVVGALTSAAAAFYYLGLIVVMYTQRPAEELPVPQLPPRLVVALAVTALLTVEIGLLPGPYVAFTQAILPLR
ncbi:MAG: NADH-quinone oxidoreductase subunit N [Chloroflexi bacterium]|nr:NADH-quinone oxidoreductase subunit N [Chloroflexota bacterium]